MEHKPPSKEMKLLILSGLVNMLLAVILLLYTNIGDQIFSTRPIPEPTPAPNPSPTPTNTPIPTPTPAHGKKQLTDKLLSYLDDKEFAQTYQQAKAAGVSNQVLFEARFQNHFYDVDSDGLIALAPEAEKYIGHPDAKTTQLFKDKQYAQGMLHALRALSFGHAGDAKRFESEMKQAFWAYPRAGRAFGRWTNDFLSEQKMTKITVPLGQPLTTSDGHKTTLGTLLKGKKALLLDFWATWCGPCMQSMPELKERGLKLPPQGVAVAAFNTENDAKAADRVRVEQKATIPWLMEPEDRRYSHLLLLETIPHAVLISPQGKVLFNGHPKSERLKKALKKIGAEL